LNSGDYLFETEITLASDNKGTVKILSFEKKPRSKYHLHMAVAPQKWMTAVFFRKQTKSWRESTLIYTIARSSEWSIMKGLIKLF
jgi:hypothetical protein